MGAPQEPVSAALAHGLRPPGLVLLDRDGTIITETGYLVDPADLVLIPGAAGAIARLNRAGIPVALVTNQSAVGRGLLDEAGLERIHGHLADQLAQSGAHLDLVLFAPEHPTEGRGPYRRDSPRRKPGPGMLLEAMAHFAVHKHATWMVGDGARDLIAAERAGCAALAVATGKGEEEWPATVAALAGAPLRFDDLAGAVDWLLAKGP